MPSYRRGNYLAIGIDQDRGDSAIGLFAAHNDPNLASVFTFDCLRLAIAGLLEIKISFSHKTDLLDLDRLESELSTVIDPEGLGVVILQVDCSRIVFDVDVYGLALEGIWISDLIAD